MSDVTPAGDETDSEQRIPRFELHIRPMMRLLDREKMMAARDFDLWDYDDVRNHSDAISAHLKEDMPPVRYGGLWPSEWIELFDRWCAAGYPRLELGIVNESGYQITRSGDRVTIRGEGFLPSEGYRFWLETIGSTAQRKEYVFYWEPPDSDPSDELPFRIRERFEATSELTSLSIQDRNGVHEFDVTNDASRVRASVASRATTGKNITFLLFDQVETLDVTGPMDVFSMTNISQSRDEFNLLTVSESGRTVTTLGGLRLQPDYSFDDFPDEKLHALVIPGGPPGLMRQFGSRYPRSMQWIEELASQVDALATICFGALVLAQTDLFRGNEVTTHHQAVSVIEKMVPEAIVRRGARYTDNRPTSNILTSAGVSAGMDLALHMVRSWLGDSVAAATAQIMEYNATRNWSESAST